MTPVVLKIEKHQFSFPPKSWNSCLNRDSIPNFITIAPVSDSQGHVELYSTSLTFSQSLRTLSCTLRLLFTVFLFSIYYLLGSQTSKFFGVPPTSCPLFILHAYLSLYPVVSFTISLISAFIITFPNNLFLILS